MDKSVENNKPIKNRKRFAKFLNIFIIVAAVCVLALEGVLYYQRSYLTPFWVNGQSMYPTLNYNATDSNGNKLNESSGNAGVGYTVDYGVMDTHKSAINRIKRFDIIVTKYPDSDDKNKIKRVIGLPGETVEFKATGYGKPQNGDLYINGKYVEQPIPEEFIRNCSKYVDGKTWTLNSNEYFVCGDNREHSSDSRFFKDNKPQITKEYITGKVVAICGTCQVYYDGDHFDIQNIDYKWPKKVK